MMVEANGVRLYLPDECANPTFMAPSPWGQIVLEWHWKPKLRVVLAVTCRQAMLAWGPLNLPDPLAKTFLVPPIVFHEPTKPWVPHYLVHVAPLSPDGWSYLCARLPGKLPTEPPGPAIL